MKPDLSLDTEKLAALLQRLADQKPTRQTLDAVLREHAPLLAKIMRAGWTDESLVQAFQAANGDAGEDVAAFRKLLHEARLRERTAAEKGSTRRSGKDKAQPTVTPDQGSTNVKPPGAKRSGDIPFNDGI